LGAKIGKSFGILKFLLHSLPLDFDSTEYFFSDEGGGGGGNISVARNFDGHASTWCLLTWGLANFESGKANWVKETEEMENGETVKEGITT